MTTLRNAYPRLLRYGFALCALAGAIYALVLARAHWLFEEDTAASIPAAARLIPYNAAYLARLAAWLPEKKVALLQRTVALNPFDSESWMQLGFVSEFQRHDQTQAEHYYLRAADVNKMFLPKWTLTNFYFRHGRKHEFFHWAELALAITPYAPEPIFVQMWLMSQNAAEIEAAVPDRPRVLLPYAWYLSNNHQNAAIAHVVQRLVADVGKANPHAWGRDDLLAAIEDRLLAAGDAAPALHIWHTLVRARWIDETVPTAGAPLTNGNFTTPLFSHGFDWIPVRVEGISLDQMFTPSGLRLQLTGDQPENCILLEQYLPLAPGRLYEFGWNAELGSFQNPSGLTWHLRPAADLSAASISSPDLGAAAGNPWRAPAPAANGLALLTLEYHRPLGELRARGTLLLRSVSARLAGSLPGAASTLNR